MHANNDAIPQKQQPIVQLATAGKIELVELVIKHARIGAARWREAYEGANVLRGRLIAGVKLDAHCFPMLRQHFACVEEMQPANHLPCYPPNSLSPESLNDLAAGQDQSLGFSSNSRLLFFTS